MLVVTCQHDVFGVFRKLMLVACFKGKNNCIYSAFYRFISTIVIIFLSTCVLDVHFVSFLFIESNDTLGAIRLEDVYVSIDLYVLSACLCFSVIHQEYMIWCKFLSVHISPLNSKGKSIE